MRYEKPTVESMGAAIDNVHNCSAAKKHNVAEGPPCNTSLGTSAAYEADE